MNCPLRSAGNEDTEGEIVVEQSVPDRGHQLRLPIFSSAFGHDLGFIKAGSGDQLALALVEAVDQDNMREGVDVTCSTSSKILKWTNDKGIHLAFE
jgi:hypothetical protein